MSDRPLIPFPHAPDVPILGNPIEVGGFSIHAAAVCKCDNPKPLLLTMTSAQKEPQLVQCPSCQRFWTIGRDTKVHLDVASVIVRESRPQ